MGNSEVGNSSTAHSLLSTPHIVEAANQLAEKHHFFHWCLEFPEVFGGIGNGEVGNSNQTTPNSLIPTPSSQGIGNSEVGNSNQTKLFII